jgi:predicted phage tail protein
VTVPKTTTSYKITSGLDFDTTYWWRVRAEHTSYGPSGWSEVRTFDTPVAAPAAPVLLTPADDAVLTDRTPDFDWEDSAGATKYKIQISVKADFSTMISKAKVQTSEFTQPTNLPLNKTLYWRVKAIGPGGKSAWSEVWTFTIIE